MENDGIRQLQQRAQAAAAALGQARQAMGIQYGALLLFPNPPPNPSQMLSTDPQVIMKEWEVEIEGMGTDVSLAMERLGWTPLGSLGMQLYNEAQMMRQHGMRMLGAGCMSIRYTQPYFDVIAVQFNKPQYVPNITLQVEPICASSPSVTNGGLSGVANMMKGSVGNEALGAAAPVTTAAAVLQKIMGMILDEAQQQQQAAGGAAAAKDDLNAVVTAALARRMTPSHKAVGSFDLITTHVVSGCDGALTADPLAIPAEKEGEAVLNTSMYCLRNGYLFTLALEGIKEVHDKYLPEVLGRIAGGVIVNPYADICKGLGSRMHQRMALIAADQIKEQQQRNGSPKRGSGGSNSSTPLSSAQLKVWESLAHLTLPIDHAYSCAVRGIDYAAGPHRRIAVGSAASVTTLKAPLDWLRLTACAAKRRNNANDNGNDGAQSTTLAIDPCTKRMAFLSNADGDSLAVEPLAVEEKVFGGGSSNNNAADATLVVERFVTTPNAYSTGCMLRPELVTVATSQQSTAADLAASFADALLAAAHATTRWVEVPSTVATTSSSSSNAATRCRRFLCWRRVSMGADVDSVAPTNTTCVDFIVDECAVYAAGRGVVIVRSIRPSDYALLIAPTLGAERSPTITSMLQMMGRNGLNGAKFYITKTEEVEEGPALGACAASVELMKSYGGILTTGVGEVDRLLASITVIHTDTKKKSKDKADAAPSEASSSSPLDAQQQQRRSAEYFHIPRACMQIRRRDGANDANAPVAVAHGDVFNYMPMGRMVPTVTNASDAAGTAFSGGFSPIATITVEPIDRALALWEQSNASSRDPRMLQGYAQMGLTFKHNTFTVKGSGGRWDVADLLQQKKESSSSSSSGDAAAPLSMAQSYFGSAPVEQVLGIEGLVLEGSNSTPPPRLTAHRYATFAAAMAAALKLAPTAALATPAGLPKPNAGANANASSPNAAALYGSAQGPQAVEWTCYHHTLTPDPAATGEVKIPSNGQQVGMLLNGCLGRSILIPSLAAGRGGESSPSSPSPSSPSPLLQNAIIIQWSFVQNIEDLMLDGLGREVLGQYYAPRHHSKEEAESEGASASVAADGSAAAGLPPTPSSMRRTDGTLWSAGPRQFVKDWEVVRAIMMGLVKEDVILPACI